MKTSPTRLKLTNSLCSITTFADHILGGRGEVDFKWQPGNMHLENKSHDDT